MDKSNNSYNLISRFGEKSSLRSFILSLHQNLIKEMRKHKFKTLMLKSVEIIVEPLNHNKNKEGFCSQCNKRKKVQSLIM